MIRSVFPPQLLLKALALAFVMVVSAPVMPTYAQGCLSSAQVRSAIAAGEILPLSVINSVASSRGYAQVTSVNVCGSPGNRTYRVVAIRSSGQTAQLTIDAQSGRLLSER